MLIYQLLQIYWNPAFEGMWLLSSPVRYEVNENHEWLVFFVMQFPTLPTPPSPQPKKEHISQIHIYVWSM